MEIEKTRKRKAFGVQKSVSSESTSTTAPSKEKYNVWNNALTQQKKLLDLDVNTQFIPLEMVELDPKNARKSNLTLGEINKAPKLNENNVISEEFELAVTEFFEETDPVYSELKITEYLSLSQLATSIGSADNLIHPVLVYLEEGKFKLVAGHRRTLAHYILNSEIIFAKILPIKPDALEKSVLQWKENYERKNLSLYEKIIFIDNLTSVWSEITKEKVSIATLMSLLSFRKTMASYFISVLNAFKTNPKFRNAVEMDILNAVKTASGIAKLPSDMQDKTLDLLLQGCSADMKSYERIGINKKALSQQQKHSNFGLRITKDIRLSPITSMLEKLICLPEVSKRKQDFKDLDLNDKNDALKAWQILYELFDSK